MKDGNPVSVPTSINVPPPPAPSPGTAAYTPPPAQGNSNIPQSNDNSSSPVSTPHALFKILTGGFIDSNLKMTPAMAGGVTFLITTPLQHAFAIDGRWIALVVSFILGFIVYTSKDLSIWKRRACYLINCLIIFAVATGMNYYAGKAELKVLTGMFLPGFSPATPDVPHSSLSIEFVSSASAQQDPVLEKKLEEIEKTKEMLEQKKEVLETKEEKLEQKEEQLEKKEEALEQQQIQQQPAPKLFKAW